MPKERIKEATFGRKDKSSPLENRARDRQMQTGDRIGDARNDTTKEEPFEIRYASDKAFSEAHRKTSKVHADLFRRLAE